MQHENLAQLNILGVVPDINYPSILEHTNMTHQEKRLRKLRQCFNSVTENSEKEKRLIRLVKIAKSKCVFTRTHNEKAYQQEYFRGL